MSHKQSGMFVEVAMSVVGIVMFMSLIAAIIGLMATVAAAVALAFDHATLDDIIARGGWCMVFAAIAASCFAIMKRYENTQTQSSLTHKNRNDGPLNGSGREGRRNFRVIKGGKDRN